MPVGVDYCENELVACLGQSRKDVHEWLGSSISWTLGYEAAAEETASRDHN